MSFEDFEKKYNEAKEKRTKKEKNRYFKNRCDLDLDSVIKNLDNKTPNDVTKFYNSLGNK